MITWLCQVGPPLALVSTMLTTSMLARSIVLSAAADHVKYVWDKAEPTIDPLSIVDTHPMCPGAVLVLRVENADDIRDMVTSAEGWQLLTDKLDDHLMWCESINGGLYAVYSDSHEVDEDATVHALTY